MALAMIDQFMRRLEGPLYSGEYIHLSLPYITHIQHEIHSLHMQCSDTVRTHRYPIWLVLSLTPSLNSVLFILSTKEKKINYENCTVALAADNEHVFLSNQAKDLFFFIL